MQPCTHRGKMAIVRTGRHACTDYDSAVGRHACMHADWQIVTPRNLHADRHARTSTSPPACTSHTHTHIDTRNTAHINAYTVTDWYNSTHTHIHAHTHTRTRTPTRIHTLSLAHTAIRRHNPYSQIRASRVGLDKALPTTARCLHTTRQRFR